MNSGLAFAVLLFNLNPLFFLPLIPWDLSLLRNCREANETLAWLHDRMPAILPDKESVTAWLDPHLHGTSALEVLPRTLSKEQVSVFYTYGFSFRGQILMRCGLHLGMQCNALGDSQKCNHA